MLTGLPQRLWAIWWRSKWLHVSAFDIQGKHILGDTAHWGAFWIHKEFICISRRLPTRNPYFKGKNIYPNDFRRVRRQIWVTMWKRDLTMKILELTYQTQEPGESCERTIDGIEPRRETILSFSTSPRGQWRFKFQNVPKGEFMETEEMALSWLFDRLKIWGQPITQWRIIKPKVFTKTNMIPLPKGLYNQLVG